MRREKTRSKRDDMRMRRTLEPCVYAISVRHAKKLYQKNVSATRSVFTPPVAHTVVATTWVRTPVGTTPTSKSKKKKKHHSMTTLREYIQTSFKFFFDLSHQDLVHLFAFHQSSDAWVNASRFPEACSSSDSRWCLCVEFWIWVPVHHEALFPTVWVCVHSPLYFLEYHVGVCNEMLELLSYATRNCLLHAFSSRPSHSKCCPYECFFYLHVLLVLVIPRSTNCDSLMELGRSLTFVILISVSQELHQTSKFSYAQMFRSVDYGPFEA